MPLLALTRHPGGLRSATRNCGQPMSGPRLLHTGALPSPQLHPEPPGTASACALAGLHSDLEKLAPRFNINSKQIKILRCPNDFYSILKEKIRSAKYRIFLSTLYIGAAEYELFENLRHALQMQSTLKLSVLSDALRGTRESPRASCASLLAPLVKEFGENRVDIRMYHTPALSGWKRMFIPARLNEGWGLQHMKLYGFDDEIILSGANLSTDYFTNRQDRYHIFSSKRLTDYYASIHHAVSSLSFRVVPGEARQQEYQLVWPATNLAPLPTQQPEQFRHSATTLLKPLLEPLQQLESDNAPLTDTVVYPLGQFTQLFRPTDGSTELLALSKVLQLLTLPGFSDSSWTFTAGYFNIHPTLKKILLESKSKHASIITAHPHANGFFGSPGISGNLPPGYSLLAKKFLVDVYAAGKQDNIVLREWKRGKVGVQDGWTYHAKGIWVNMPGEEEPSLTLVGSSNYTRRSYSFDLEMNALIITKSEKLKQEFLQEVQNLEAFTTPKRLEHFTENFGWRVRFLVWLLEKQL